MSHFLVMVIGDYPEEQLSYFAANRTVDERCVGMVSDPRTRHILESNYLQGYTYAPVEPFNECYEEDEEKGRWRRDAEDGEWREYATWNPDSKWERYVLGGHWSGAFIRLREGAESGICGKTDNFLVPAEVDIAMKGDIDFESFFQETEQRARDFYRLVARRREKGISHVKQTLWDVFFMERYRELSHVRFLQLYQDRHCQRKWDYHTRWMPARLHSKDGEYSEDEFVTRWMQHVLTPAALLIHGKWYDEGQTGWDGGPAGRCTSEEWSHKIRELLHGLPDDTLIAFYDCQN